MQENEANATHKKLNAVREQFTKPIDIGDAALIAALGHERTMGALKNASSESGSMAVACGLAPVHSPVTPQSNMWPGLIVAGDLHAMS